MTADGTGRMYEGDPVEDLSDFTLVAGIVRFAGSDNPNQVSTASNMMECALDKSKYYFPDGQLKPGAEEALGLVAELGARLADLAIPPEAKVEGTHGV